MSAQNVFIYGTDNCIPGVLRLPDRNDNAPAVIFTNGYCAYHEMYDELAQRFCDAGYATLQYDNRGSAGSDHSRMLCGTQWLEDLSACIGYMSSLKTVDSDRIGLAGVSMGGAMTIMQGARDPRIKCMYAMAPVFTGLALFRDPWISNHAEAGWKAFWKEVTEDAARMAQGFPSKRLPTEYTCGGQKGTSESELLERKQHPLKVTELPLESVLNVVLYVDSLTPVMHCEKPICFVHGTGDATIPYSYTQQLFDASVSKDKELHFIPDAGHVLPEVAAEETMKYGLDFFARYL